MRRAILPILLGVLLPLQAQTQTLPGSDEERQLVVAMDGLPEEWARHGVIRRMVAIRMEHAAIVHRLRFDLVDAEGLPVVGAGDWRVTILDRDPEGQAQVLATLGHDRPELRVPRPFGLALAVDDSLDVVVEVSGLGAAGTSLRATIAYELPGATAMRLPVVALRGARAMRDSSGREDAWTWVPDRSGQLVALSGEAMGVADEVVLEDAATGTVLWRARSPRGVGGIAAAASAAQFRPAVPLSEGRAYRLRAIYGEAAAAVRRAVSSPLAVLLPSGE